ncbi:hypothetical protein ACOSQ3_007307 [Xanthoceras sorbifolium]
MLFVKSSKTEVHQPGYRFSFDYRGSRFLFLSLSLSPTLSFSLSFLFSSSSSSSSSSFFFFLFFFSFFLSRSLLSLFSALSVWWLLAEAKFFFYIFRSSRPVVVPPGRGTH